MSDETFDNTVGPQVRAKKKPIALPLIFGSGVSVSVGLVAATQLLANTFDYQAILGPSFYGLYAPWNYIGWSDKWGHLYPDQFYQAFQAGLLSSAGSALAISGMIALWRKREKIDRYLHGSARWAAKKDILAAGLIAHDRNNSGVYVGGWRDKKDNFHYLRHDGPEHILTFAPSRSGKGVGLVIPTLLSWAGSAVVTDLKGELWALTAGWRKEGAHNKVLKFEPSALEGSICWNPMDEVRLGTAFEAGDAQNLATIIVDPDGKGLNSHWDKTSFALITGLILHALRKAQATKGVATLSTVDGLLSDPALPLDDLWDEMIHNDYTSAPNITVIRTAQDMVERDKKEASSIISSVKAFLALYRDPVIVQNTSFSEFCIDDLMNHVHPVTLYIVTQPADKDRLKPLVRLLITMMIRKLTKELDFKEGQPVASFRHRLLFMLDEFPALGRLPILQEALAFLAGYGIKCYLICQDINQLKNHETGYGPSESISSNCQIQIAFPPNRMETAEYISKLTGTTTITRSSTSTSGEKIAVFRSKVSITKQHSQRALQTPDETLRMPTPKKGPNGLIEEPGDMLVFASGHPAIYGEQPLYFQDQIFSARASVKMPPTSDVLRRKKSAENERIIL